MDGLTEAQACEIEKYLIAKYKANDERYGYNHSTGGDNTFAGSHTDQHGGKSVRSRKIRQYTKDGVFVREWDASTDIQRELGYHYTNIIKCCTETIKFSNGFVWLYAEEATPENIKRRCEKAQHRYNAPFTETHRRNMSHGIKQHYATTKESA